MVKIPPSTLPENLSEAEYKKLSTLYMILGRMDLASQANEKCASPTVPDKPLTELSAEEQYQLGSSAGQKFAFKLLDIIQEGDLNSEEKLAAAVESMRGIIPDTVIEQLLSTLPKSFESARSDMQLTREVPSGLSAQEYLDLAKKYKVLGWTEPAREALQHCINLDGGGKLSDEAMQFLRMRLPRYPVPLMAEVDNIKGYNLVHTAKDYSAAKKVFVDLIKRYPDFEWPYANLGSLYLQEGSIEKAHDTYLNAIKINPHYANAWIGLGRVNIFKSEFQQARYCFNKASEVETDTPAAMFISMVERIEEWDAEASDDC